MRSSPLAILCGKGDSGKIREGANFLKLTDKFSREEGELRGLDSTCIGISSTGNYSVSDEKNIHHSLELYDTLNYQILFDNQGADAGGGEMWEDLGKKLGKEN